MDKDCRETFERETANWGLYFDSWNGEYYEDYATAINARAFELGWTAARKYLGIQNDRKEWYHYHKNVKWIQVAKIAIIAVIFLIVYIKCGTFLPGLKP